MVPPDASQSGEGRDLPPTMITFSVPWPPSVNHYWSYIPAKPPRVIPLVVVGTKGKKYRREIEYICKRLNAMPGRLAVQLLVHPPDRRKRDLDNLQKALLDALQHGGIYEDDSVIDEISIKRMQVDPQKAGFIDVLVQVIADPVSEQLLDFPERTKLDPLFDEPEPPPF